MASRILADVTASVTELQKDPMGTAASGNGAAVAILNRNALAFYCVPASEYHADGRQAGGHRIKCPC